MKTISNRNAFELHVSTYVYAVADRPGGKQVAAANSDRVVRVFRLQFIVPQTEFFARLSKPLRSR